MLEDMRYVCTQEGYDYTLTRYHELDDMLYISGELSEEDQVEHDMLVDVLNNCRVINEPKPQ